ncbi:MAG: MASE1 domain-containing protein [Planctomycetes bacterium]|nr:MASE1 domain-containing protein [Planctomycetota bacterium]
MNLSLRDVRIQLGLVAAYIVAGKLSLSFALVDDRISAVWLPTGIALAAIVLHGVRLWPAIAIGAFLVNLSTGGSAVASAGIALGNTLEAVIGGALVRRFACGRDAFALPGGVFAFAVLAGVLATLVAACFGVASLALGGFIVADELLEAWLTWWIGDAVGAIIVAPVIVLWWNDPRPSRMPGHHGEALIAFLALVTTAILVMGGVLPSAVEGDSLEYLCLLPLVWIASRFGPREAGTAALALCAIAIWGTLRGHGPFTRGEPNRALVLLQAFMGAAAVMSLAVAALSARRRRLEVELERSNAELEQFAYVASHDLQEPLRAVASYSEVLQRRYRGRLDEAGDRYLAQVHDGAKRMLAMVQGLLDYARIGREAKVEPVDLAIVLGEILHDLEPAIHDAGAVLTHDELPQVRAVRSDMYRLFLNLLGNALKFRGSAPARVHIACERRGKRWMISVRDNGIGIDPAHRERIFSMFGRLHGDEQPGYGIGLAVCKKIVERSGGEISLQSQPGQGSTFTFTLPSGA